jgi:hypothetical protein
MDHYTDVQHGIRRVWANGKRGIGMVWRAANGMQKPESPVFKPTLTVRPDMTVVCEARTGKVKRSDGL